MTSREDAVREYEEERAKSWRFLWKGLIFMAICAAIYELLQTYTFPLSNFIASAATIAGWVALWTPVEQFLYELPEMRRQLQKKSNS